MLLDMKLQICNSEGMTNEYRNNSLDDYRNPVELLEEAWQNIANHSRWDGPGSNDYSEAVSEIHRAIRKFNEAWKAEQHRLVDVSLSVDVVLDNCSDDYHHS